MKFSGIRLNYWLLGVIKVFSIISYSDAVSVIRKQIIRCSTSVAANYRAVNQSRSEKERYAKLSIVVEEADETLFWLELVEEFRFNSGRTDRATKTKG